MNYKFPKLKVTGRAAPSSVCTQPRAAKEHDKGLFSKSPDRRVNGTIQQYETREKAQNIRNVSVL
jgi:hypothetical protein